MTTFLALGDCNTLGVQSCNAYPQQLATQLGITVTNCGHTMATVREGQRLFCAHFDEQSVEFVTLQFGLVDSWHTVRYAPYILYYPDNVLRRLGRKLIKKYKKLGRKWGLNRLLGVAPVVPLSEYIHWIEQIVAVAPQVFLLDTVPNKESARNAAIQQYNAALTAIAHRFAHVHKVDLYAHFAGQMDTLYLDNTHINQAGHDYIAAQLKASYEHSCLAL